MGHYVSAAMLLKVNEKYVDEIRKICEESDIDTRYELLKQFYEKNGFDIPEYDNWFIGPAYLGDKSYLDDVFNDHHNPRMDGDILMTNGTFGRIWNFRECFKNSEYYIDAYLIFSKCEDRVWEINCKNVTEVNIAAKRIKDNIDENELKFEIDFSSDAIQVDRIHTYMDY